MKRCLACLCLLCCLGLAGGCQVLPPGAAPDPAEYSRRVLVTFEMPPGAARAVLGPKYHYHHRDSWRAPLHLRAWIDRFAGDHALVELDGWPIASLELYCVLFGVTQPGDLPRLLGELRKEPGVTIAQPLNRFYGLTLPKRPAYDDPYVDLQYGEGAAALYALHQFTRGGDVRVGVIDSPVDGRHPDLRGQLVRQHDLVPAEEPGDRLHGTAVAGVIAARDNNGEGGVGLAPRARLYSYGACGGQQGRTVCNSFDLARAVEEAIQDRIQVLNLSLAGPPDPLLEVLLSEAIGRGMIVVASNNGDPASNFPASHPGVVAAGRVPGAEGRGAAARADSWFLREEQLSTRAGGGYQYFYGSSIASAGAAGLAALIRSQMGASRASRLLASLAGKDCGELAAASGSGFERAVGIVAGCRPADTGTLAGPRDARERISPDGRAL